MKLRTRLRLAAVLFLGLAVVASAVLMLASNRLDTAIARSRDLDRVVAEVFGLSQVTHDYLMHRSARALAQWRVKNEQLEQLLGEITLDRPEDEASMEHLRRDRGAIAGLFLDYVNAHSDGPAGGEADHAADEAQERLAAQVAVRSQDIASEAFRLADAVCEQVVEIKRSRGWLVMGLVILVGMALAAVPWVIDGAILRPLARLRQGVDVIAAGDLSQEVPVRGAEEVSQLATAFNKMTAGLKESYEALAAEVVRRRQAEESMRQAHDRLSRIMDASPAGVLVYDREGRFAFANRRAGEILGLSGARLAGLTYDSPDMGRMNSLGEPISNEKTLFRRVMADGKPILRERRILGTPDGNRVHSVLNVAPLFDADGRPDGVVYVMEDVTEQVKAEEQLRESRELMAAFMAHSPAHFHVTSAEGRLRLVSRAMERLLGIPAEQMVGRPLEKVFPAEAVRSFRESNQRVIDTAGPDVVTQCVDSPAGPRHFHTVNFPLFDPRGAVAAIGGVSIDVTDRVHAERKVRRLAAFPQLNPSPVVEVRLDGRVEYLNPAAARLFPDLPEKGLDHPFLADLRSLMAGLHSGDAGVAQRKVSVGDAIYWQSILLTPQGDSIHVYGVDITQRVRGEERLVAYQKRLRSLASQLVLSEEKERRRIAVFMHDQLGQTLAVAQMKAREAQSDVAAGPGRDALAQALELLKQATQDTRSLTFDLSPPILYELGFGPAIEWLAESFQRQHGIRVELADTASSHTLTEDVRIVLFLAVRELLVNIVKHAHAKSVKVSISQEGDRLCVRLTDDGKGFDPAVLTAHGSHAGGFGLFNVHERLEHLGGRFEIESAPGHGTTATLAAPLLPSE